MSSRTFQTMTTSSSLVTSTPEWVLTMTLGPSCLGHFGVGKINENGQRLLELCSFHSLCVTNFYYPDKAPAQSVMETSTLQALAPAGPGHCQTNKPQDCASHSLIPQRGLRHRPLTSVQQDQTSTEEAPSYKDSGEVAHRHDKDAASG